MKPFNGQNGQVPSRNRQFRCCVPGCKTRSSNGFHNFPTDTKVCLEWMKRTHKEHLDVKQISKSFHKVCKQHFDASDFQINISGKKKLKKGVVPRLNLPGQAVNFESNVVQGIPQQAANSMQEEPLEEDINGNTASLTEEIGRSNENFVAKIIELEEKIKQLKAEKSKIQIKLRRSQNKVKLLRQTIKANKIDDANVIKYLSQIFNDKQLEFFKMQIKNSGKKNRGQRYTLEQKSLCLSLYKHGPKSYRFMQKIFALPCKRTLQRHNAYLHFEAGIDDELLEFIKEQVKNMPEIEKLCILSWDEQALKSHLDYNHVNDYIDGFTDLGYLRRSTFATHSLPFMVRGINSGFKQSVAFFYTDDLKSFELAEIIRLVTEAILDTGLKIIGSTCDQVNINVSALSSLINPKSLRPRKQDGEILKYKVRDVEIIHCFDLPHLIKVIRHNLLEKDLIHCISNHWNIYDNEEEQEEATYIASWDDITEVYRFDSKSSNRLLKKITDEHIKPIKMKMKVSLATQIFSRKFGNVMLHFSEQGPYPNDCFGTAQALLFFNDLFDSLNGSDEPQQDTLFGSINESSINFVYWEYALKMLAKMTFIDKLTGKPNNRSSVIYKFMSTIRGYIELTRMCLHLNMKEVALRNGNQDGLENLFGGINECNHVLKSIPTHFKTGYATMQLNNMNSKTSLSSNCEDDFSKPLLNNVHEMLLHRKEKSKLDDKNKKISAYYSNDIIMFEPEILTTHLSYTENESLTYISSVVCRKILEKTSCPQCDDNLQTSANSKSHDIINRLGPSDPIIYRHPSPTFMKVFKRLFDISSQIIPELCSEKFLKTEIVNELEKKELDQIGCIEHNKEITAKIKNYAAYYAIIDFCKNINNLLSGKVTSLPTNSNDMLELALRFREKGKHKGKYSDKFCP